ncbi:5439_t:CDS:2 [Paraglomus brasilianum]|uniref:5439_t:CDS:1 n=1 Tax=Paraglomus brasilianum TaxID=144538 RepID=A0A9N9A712_9GLOM|nr:5439_t:CDS:2 [Paraglomus brasilianum]
MSLAPRYDVKYNIRDRARMLRDDHRLGERRIEMRKGHVSTLLPGYEPMPDWPTKKPDPSRLSGTQRPLLIHMIECKALDNFYDSTKSEEETEKKTEGDNEKESEEARG